MASIESAVIRVVATVSNQLSPTLNQLVPARSAAISPPLLNYLDSPDFAEVTRQVVLWRTMRGDLDSGLAADLREQIVQGLRLSGASGDPKEVLDALTAVDPLSANALDTQTAVAVAHLATAARNNTLVLRRATSLEDFHEYARKLRRPIAAMHAVMRLPHIGVSRSVPYDELYVRPTVRLSVSVEQLTLPGRRTVLLGNPGAGKSTLANKLTYDVAKAPDGRVPFLLVLRDHTSWFREGGRELLKYLKHVCRDPYNLAPPRDALEYLLRNGRAVVVLDGLDELVETELRRRVVRLVEGFAHQFPLTPVVVTARKIGYGEAPLSESLFAKGTVEDFAPDQVSEYAVRWFALDASTPSHQRRQLADAFLRESKTIEDLRRNPLLLALLCAMYSSEHYLPHNLAQVYERCALMLFDRWDKMRGISLPVQFHGRLRSAVQHLAWHQFTAKKSGAPQPRSRIVQLLADYLESKSFDADEALEAAEHFVEFCTGRAWILTDLGATRTEPQFGFTHRTFLEYFAAEHLVRKHTSAQELWQALKPKSEQVPWEVISRIALQLHDRNAEDGADEILLAALADDAVDFATDALGYVTPRPQVIAEIVARIITSVVDSDAYNQGQRKELLRRSLQDSLPANTSIVNRAVLHHVTAMCDAQHPATSSVVRLLLVTRWLDPEYRPAIRNLHRKGLEEVERLPDNWPWLPEVDTLLDLVSHVRQCGPSTLFDQHSFLGEYIPAPVSSLLSFSNVTPFDRTDADQLSVVIAIHLTPWMSGNRWLSDYDLASTRKLVPQGKLHTGLTALLCLPYLEMHVDHGQALPFQSMAIHEHLAEGRRGHHAQTVDAESNYGPVPAEVENLLDLWMRRQFDVFDWHRDEPALPQQTGPADD
ncbi:NACHT domain-containing protein [Lentzea sp. NPDC005914]|uniref:NACHT domain-containing protein n=1 Tax=Lentzea sp. NPDC005914 TaxID=3154572 RepID=UPI003400A7D3